MKTKKEYNIWMWTCLAIMWISNIGMWLVKDTAVDIGLIIIWVVFFVGWIYNFVKPRWFRDKEIKERTW